MTVKELKELLAEYPDGAKVYFECKDPGDWRVESVSAFIPKPWGGWLTLTGVME